MTLLKSYRIPSNWSSLLYSNSMVWRKRMIDGKESFQKKKKKCIQNTPRTKMHRLLGWCLVMYLLRFLWEFYVSHRIRSFAFDIIFTNRKKTTLFFSLNCDHTIFFADFSFDDFRSIKWARFFIFSLSLSLDDGFSIWINHFEFISLLLSIKVSLQLIWRRDQKRNPFKNSQRHLKRKIQFYLSWNYILIHFFQLRSH